MLRRAGQPYNVEIGHGGTQVHYLTTGPATSGEFGLYRWDCLNMGRYTPAMSIADRLESLGIELPPPFPPAGNYLACVIDEGLVYVGGHGPIAGDQMMRGKVGGDLTLEQGRVAARMTALSILATLQAELGDLSAGSSGSSRSSAW